MNDIFTVLQGGQITRERILVLFFFCSDLAILAVRCKLNGLMARLTQWTLVFIRDQVNTRGFLGGFI